jgi:hypothetical protein
MDSYFNLGVTYSKPIKNNTIDADKFLAGAKTCKIIEYEVFSIKFIPY